MPMTPDAIIKRFERLQGDRANWESQWQDIADLVMPNRQFTTERSPGEERNFDVYDSTAPIKSRNLAFAIHGLLTNPGAQWFSLTPVMAPGDDLSPAMRAWLQDVATLMRAVFSNDELGFNSAIMETYHEWVNFGTAVFYPEEIPGMSKTEPMRFRSVPLSDCFIEEDFKGKINALYRKFELTNSQAIDQYGIKNVAQQVRDAMKDGTGKPEERRRYLQAVFPRDVFRPAPAAPVDKQFASIHIDLMAKAVVKESGFDEFPFHVPRWSVASGEVYGRGPGTEALPDIRMVNAMSKTLIVAGEKAVHPPMQVPANSLTSPLRIHPGAIIWYRPGMSEPIRPLQTGMNMPLGFEMVEQRQRSIGDAYFSDIVDALPQNDRMTTVEINARLRQRMQLLSPVVSRLGTELLGPLIFQVYSIMQRRGALPEIPKEEGRPPVAVRYVSPLALSQESSVISNLEQWLGLLSPLVQIDPGLRHHVNNDSIVQGTADLFNVPREFVNSQDRANELRAEEEERVAAAEQAENLKTTAAAAELGTRAIGNVQAA